MLVLSPHAWTQEPKVDDLAERLAKEIAKANFKSVLVTDFTDLDGNASPAGKVLGERLLDYWLSHRKKFSIVERSRLDVLLNEQNLTLKDLDNSDTLRKIGESLGFDAIVIGTVTPNSDGCSLNVVVRRTQDSILQSSATKSFSDLDLPRYARNPPSDEPTERPVQAGLKGVVPPACIHCPNPDYTDELRRQKIEGVVFLSIVVTQEGRVTAAKVIKAPDDELARKALEAVRTWRLKPANGPDGKPVPARINVEVWFRLLK